jgi:hypothetical protein
MANLEEVVHKEQHASFLVRTKKFEISVQALRKYPNSMLTKMISSENKLIDTLEDLPLDRDPVIFQVIVDYYRTGT